jgi:hypothetical protein
MKGRSNAGFPIVRPVRAGFISSLLAVLALTSLLSVPSGAEILTVDQWIDLGWDYYNAGNVEEAFNTFLQAVEYFPESAEAHLALGEVYLEMEIVDRGRAELLKSLQLDDRTGLAAVAHYDYAVSMREEDTWLALLHLDAAHRLGGSSSLQFEIAQQIRFCHLLLQMTGRSQSGPVVLHYADYVLASDEGDSLAREAESSLYLAESFCYFDVTKPLHIFLYPSERAVRAEIREPVDEMDPPHREYHVVYTPGIDLLPQLCMQVVADLQDDMNRHAGAGWVIRGLPTAVTRLVPWGDAGEAESEGYSYIDCDEAVCGLKAAGALVELRYLVVEECAPYIPEPIARAELGSFLRWVRRTYDRRKFTELITQPNVELVLGEDTQEIGKMWIDDVLSTPNLIADPSLAGQWVANQPVSPLSGDPDLPTTILKEGLRLYLSGDEIAGKWQIARALDLDPALALGYYTQGWIACREGDCRRAEDRLGMAVMLFESPEEISWCHALLAPIYLHDARWDLAQASLVLIVTYTDSQTVRDWAEQSLARLSHILALRPSPLDRDSTEFDQARDFFQAWNQAANSDRGVSPLVSDMMDDVRRASLTAFYSSIRETYPSVVFNHALQDVGVSGSSILVEVRVQAAFPAAGQAFRPASLPEELVPLTDGGYLLFFQLMPTDSGWRVLDWEDGWFPLTGATWNLPQTEARP